MADPSYKDLESRLMNLMRLNTSLKVVEDVFDETWKYLLKKPKSDPEVQIDEEIN